jgi:VIT1/CCC1 family predicted Fe2+/Mn2+ transporter
MKPIEILHKSVIVAGITLAVLGAIVSTALDAPIVLMSTALAVAAAGYGYIKVRPEPEIAVSKTPARKPMVGAAAR